MDILTKGKVIFKKTKQIKRKDVYIYIYIQTKRAQKKKKQTYKLYFW